ncbi:MAG: phosphopentomutase [Patescibacteria group bacterium]|jgi:phosphopentomutase
MKFNRIIILILDSVGCGVQRDYKGYHKYKCNTLKNIYKRKNNFHLPNLERLGLNKILFENKRDNSISGRMIKNSKGNDTFAGVWEMFGVIFRKRFRSKKTGFPKKIINKIQSNLGISIVGNEYISGFKALDKYFFIHAKQKSPILYLADDGVVLLAAHEKIIKPAKLNEMGRKIVKFLKNENISRIITRPFVGEMGNFVRTEGRRDFIATKDFIKKSILKNVNRNHIKILTTEHLGNILGNSPNINYIKGNFDNNNLLKIIVKSLKTRSREEILLFCLQDFDMFGHKKDVDGYARKLSEFDKKLPKIINSLRKKDLLIMTADHGCDPTLDIRGHTRELVPLILYSKSLRGNVNLGTRLTFADVGQTICLNFDLPKFKNGTSLLNFN